MAKAGNVLVRKLRSTYSRECSDGLRPYLGQLLTNVPPNGGIRLKIRSTCGDAPSETALFKKQKNRLVPVAGLPFVDSGTYVTTTPELARLGWHAGSDALNWKYHVWAVGFHEGVKIARKFGLLGYFSTGFLREFRRAVHNLQGAGAEGVSAVGHSPLSLKFITDLGGKSISRIKSCLHLCGKNAEKANDSAAKLLPVKYSFYIDACRDGSNVRADVLVMIASQEAISGKRMRELDSAIKSAQNRTGVALRGLLDFEEVYQLTGIAGSAEKKAAAPALAQQQESQVATP